MYTVKLWKNVAGFFGNEPVDEIYEYKNLGIVKIYVGSFSPNEDENI